MIGDIIHIREEYFATAQSILDHIGNPALNTIHKLVIGIAGESGSGKSVTAVCLQQTLNNWGIPSYILHLDDYFLLPPASNHAKRLESIENVGPQEVRLDVLQDHILEFRRGDEMIEKPLVYYKQNQILAETVNVAPYQILIVEGTYTLLLDAIDVPVFMDRTYLETKANRMARGREVDDPFIEAVLKREHQIIRPCREKAHYIVQKDYSVLNIKTR